MEYLVLFLMGLFSSYCIINSEIITQFRHCAHSNCTITNLNINPCPEALYNKSCEIFLGNNVTITFDYFPYFNSQEPKVSLSKVKQLIDYPLLENYHDGCLYTSCPIQNNVLQKFKIEIKATESVRMGVNRTKLRLWDSSHTRKTDDECCIYFSMKFVENTSI
ncbi:MD-2-related lipid-recognition protein-like [Daktulosphaira vitifoliae]|uniref:MD-2-related lipid-recognition protein-like n=1 Tax=Daktulosphaira vitifoliae TaxID=58002 RepID=UPI0021AA6FF1|nr:MD-2-related lipid-recognition protein-like [Daktulosphaira vitifoliae]